MKNEILLGDEAVALGAVHAGLSAASSYPGTPASEIMEYLIRASGRGAHFAASWSVNEKTAYEEALGASFAGKRAMVSFKHVGLNVAADPFMNSAVTGANGGLVVVSADDPGMHSSQNEQDSRYYARFAQVFCFEPGNHQEAYDMTREAFDLSEELGSPVMVRMVTRLAHSRSSVTAREPRPQNSLRTGEGKDWILLPVNARRRFDLLLRKQPDMVRIAEGSRFNTLALNEKSRSLGVIASGIGYSYLREWLDRVVPAPSVLKVGTYPLPEALVARLFDHADTILVVEEGAPLIERRLKGQFGIPGKTLKGKLSGDLPPSGELTPDIVREALGLVPAVLRKPGPIVLPERPPQLCVGCPHADTFKALNKARETYPASRVFSDIGCYTLGGPASVQRDRDLRLHGRERRHGQGRFGRRGPPRRRRHRRFDLRPLRDHAAPRRRVGRYGHDRRHPGQRDHRHDRRPAELRDGRGPAQARGRARCPEGSHPGHRASPQAP